MEEKKIRDILPSNGVWTEEGFARWLGTSTGTVMQYLSDMNVPVISFGRLYRMKVFRLEDLRVKGGRQSRQTETQENA